jgi:hypothetical protein
VGGAGGNWKALADIDSNVTGIQAGTTNLSKSREFVGKY